MEQNEIKRKLSRFIELVGREAGYYNHANTVGSFSESEDAEWLRSIPELAPLAEHSNIGIDISPVERVFINYSRNGQVTFRVEVLTSDDFYQATEKVTTNTLFMPESRQYNGNRLEDGEAGSLGSSLLSSVRQHFRTRSIAPISSTVARTVMTEQEAYDAGWRTVCVTRVTELRRAIRSLVWLLGQKAQGEVFDYIDLPTLEKFGRDLAASHRSSAASSRFAKDAFLAMHLGQLLYRLGLNTPTKQARWLSNEGEPWARITAADMYRVSPTNYELEWCSTLGLLTPHAGPRYFTGIFKTVDSLVSGGGEGAGYIWNGIGYFTFRENKRIVEENFGERYDLSKHTQIFPRTCPGIREQLRNYHIAICGSNIQFKESRGGTPYIVGHEARFGVQPCSKCGALENLENSHKGICFSCWGVSNKKLFHLQAYNTRATAFFKAKFNLRKPTFTPTKALKRVFEMNGGGLEPIFGLEIEVLTHRDGVPAGSDSRGECVKDLIACLGDHAICKRDGSLSGGNGVEICTRPASIDEHRKALSTFFDRLDNEFPETTIKTNESCGIHVHMNRATLTPLQIGKMFRFINDPNHGTFISKVAGRYDTSYARRAERAHVTDAPRFGVAKYSMLNVLPKNTIELRMFAGSSKYGTIIKNLEFTKALVDWTAPSTAGVKDVTVDHFQNFIKTNHRDYPVLAKFLGLVVPSNRKVA